MENLCNLEWEKLVGPCQLSILITLQKPRTSQFLSVKWWESWLTSSFTGCVKCEFSWKKGRRAFNPPMPSTVRISDALSSLTWRGPWTLPLLSWCFLVQEPPGLPKPVLPNPRLTLLVEFSQTHWPVELKLWLNISRPRMSSWEGRKRRGKMLSLEPGLFSHPLSLTKGKIWACLSFIERAQQWLTYSQQTLHKSMIYLYGRLLSLVQQL